MTAMAPAGRRRPVARAGAATAGEETRERILDAALSTLTQEGFLGTTARSIAREGGFNQALLFYHFGSVDEVLVAAVERMSERRLVIYRERVEGADDLPSIVSVAREVLAEDMAGGAITVLAQLVAGAHGRAHISTRLARVWDPWIDVVESAVRRVVAGTGFEAAIPARDLAFALTGMFLGVELLSQLDPDQSKIDALFTSIDTMAALLQGVFVLLQAQKT
jgi:AcrR family transcriptional regulator